MCIRDSYKRIMMDKVFQQSIVNTFLYLIIQVPIMLILAILLAQLLNNKDLKFKGFFRTCVFLPCATSLVSYSLIFRSMFATDGLINSILIKLGILTTGYNFLGNSTSAKIVIIIALIWRWTGYNMVFYLAGLQNIEYSVYEAAKIDGCLLYTSFAEVDIERVKVDIKSGEVDIESTKVDIRNKLLSFSDTISEKTINHTVEIFSKCGKENCFGRTIVEEITGLKPSGASKLIKLLVDSEVIVPVTGHGKGKYRFQ